MLAMMQQSDNRASRGIELRYGRSAINALAQSLGMSNTAQNLAELFQLDHLATRMRRNDENLLVLAGADSTRIQREPAAR